MLHSFQEIPVLPHLLITRFVRSYVYQLSLSSDTKIETATSLNMANYPEVNGWIADPDKFCAVLPGSVAPLGHFDPLGLTSGFSVEEIKRYRESEITYGRVAMLTSLGYLLGESFHPFFGEVVSGPANSEHNRLRKSHPVSALP